MQTINRITSIYCNLKRNCEIKINYTFTLNVWDQNISIIRKINPEYIDIYEIFCCSQQQRIVLMELKSSLSARGIYWTSKKQRHCHTKRHSDTCTTKIHLQFNWIINWKISIWDNYSTRMINRWLKTVFGGNTSWLHMIWTMPLILNNK